tara:strand:+ start:20785 stop:21210 length:426 start_codon:yes stop_codon:yes gene_type:complete
MNSASDDDLFKGVLITSSGDMMEFFLHKTKFGIKCPCGKEHDEYFITSKQVREYIQEERLKTLHSELLMIYHSNVDSLLNDLATEISGIMCRGDIIFFHTSMMSNTKEAIKHYDLNPKDLKEMSHDIFLSIYKKYHAKKAF